MPTRKGRKRKPSGWAGLFRRIGDEVQREVKAALDDPAKRQVAAVTIGAAVSAFGAAVRRRVGVQTPATAPQVDRYAAAAQLLDVRLPISREALAQSYKRHAFDMHPDRGGDQGAFTRMVEAYKLLETVAT